MHFNINNTFDADLEFLVDQGLVEVQDNDGCAGPNTCMCSVHRLTYLGRMQAESMVARLPVVNLHMGMFSSPTSWNVPPDTEGMRNNHHIWAGNLVFDPRSIHRPAKLRQHVPSRKFYHPREGKDSDWVDNSTTPEEEYQRRYILIEVPSVINMAVGNKKRKGKKFNRGGKSTRVQEVWVPGNQGIQSDHDNDDSDKTANMSATGFVQMHI
jgi:hypothetical protein